MTERLYYTSDATEGRARVLSCLAEADGRYAIELDQTLFHPQGGGQPADRGWIDGIAVEGVVARRRQRHAHCRTTAAAWRGDDSGG
ncbi:alanyl-tRNA synthetase [Raoultella planticola]|nr:alanyl-tRNA synthetase [Raoultella planticola]